MSLLFLYSNFFIIIFKNIVPGAGGWPTIRYFNKQTGPQGGNYQKLHDGMSMCDELGDVDRMVDYIETYGQTSLCDIDQPHLNCSEKESSYLSKYKSIADPKELKSQLDRLVAMSSKPMKDDLKEWNFRRQRILKKLIKAVDAGGDEL